MVETTPHQDRIVLITGASRGIGYAAAKAFAAAGAHVVALARTVGGLEALDDDIKSAGGKATLIPADLNDAAAMDQLPAALAERFGRLDAYIANAGVLGDLMAIDDVPTEMWHKAFTVNVTSQARLLGSLDVLLRASEAPRVVGLTSSRARKIVPYWGLYGATKAAFESVFLTYAEEKSEAATRCNLIDPGPIATKMRAAAMPGEDPATLPQPEDLAPLIMQLASPDETRTGDIVSFKEWRAER